MGDPGWLDPTLNQGPQKGEPSILCACHHGSDGKKKTPYDMNDNQIHIYVAIDSNDEQHEPRPPIR